MARRWSPALHPRDRRGRFARAGRTARSVGSAASGPASFAIGTARRSRSLQVAGAAKTATSTARGVNHLASRRSPTRTVAQRQAIARRANRLRTADRAAGVALAGAWGLEGLKHSANKAKIRDVQRRAKARQDWLAAVDKQGRAKIEADRKRYAEALAMDLAHDRAQKDLADRRMSLAKRRVAKQEIARLTRGDNRRRKRAGLPKPPPNRRNTGGSRPKNALGPKNKRRRR